MHGRTLLGRWIRVHEFTYFGYFWGIFSHLAFSHFRHTPDWFVQVPSLWFLSAPWCSGSQWNVIRGAHGNSTAVSSFNEHCFYYSPLALLSTVLIGNAFSWRCFVQALSVGAYADSPFGNIKQSYWSAVIIQSSAKYVLKVPALFRNCFPGRLLRCFCVTNHLARQGNNMSPGTWPAHCAILFWKLPSFFFSVCQKKFCAPFTCRVTFKMFYCDTSLVRATFTLSGNLDCERKAVDAW